VSLGRMMPQPIGLIWPLGKSGSGPEWPDRYPLHSLFFTTPFHDLRQRHANGVNPPHYEEKAENERLGSEASKG
jgi:hypothetical protein